MQQELKEFGLSENEITVYVNLLKTGMTTANRVAVLSGMKRSTTYDTLHTLISKGVVSTSSSNGVQQFASAQPSKLLYLVDEKKKRIEKIIPELENLQETKKERNGVTFFEGKKGIMTVLNDILDKKPSDLLFIGSRKMAKIPLQQYPDNFVRQRVEKNIFIKGFLAQEDATDEFMKDAKAEAISDFTYRKELNESLSDIFIYEDNVSFITNVQQPAGVIIKNKEIAQQMKKIFLWLEKN